MPYLTPSLPHSLVLSSFPFLSPSLPPSCHLLCHPPSLSSCLPFYPIPCNHTLILLLFLLSSLSVSLFLLSSLFPSFLRLLGSLPPPFYLPTLLPSFIIFLPLFLPSIFPCLSLIFSYLFLSLFILSPLTFFLFFLYLPLYQDSPTLLLPAFLLLTSPSFFSFPHTSCLIRSPFLSLILSLIFLPSVFFSFLKLISLLTHFLALFLFPSLLFVSPFPPLLCFLYIRFILTLIFIYFSSTSFLL